MKFKANVTKTGPKAKTVELGVVDHTVPLPDIPAAIMKALTRRSPRA